MAKVKIVLNRQGIRDYMRSPSVQALVLSHARRVAGLAGSGHEADVQAGKNRAQARVTANSDQAVRDNLEHNVLLKALGGS